MTESDGTQRTLTALQALTMTGMGMSPFTLTSTSGVRLFDLAVAAP